MLKAQQPGSQDKKHTWALRTVCAQMSSPSLSASELDWQLRTKDLLSFFLLRVFSDAFYSAALEAGFQKAGKRGLQ